MCARQRNKVMYKYVGMETVHVCWMENNVTKAHLLNFIKINQSLVIINDPVSVPYAIMYDLLI